MRETRRTEERERQIEKNREREREGTEGKAKEREKKGGRQKFGEGNSRGGGMTQIERDVGFENEIGGRQRGEK